MASSRLFCVLLLTTLLTSIAADISWDGLRCTFSALDIFRFESFYKQPRKLDTAESGGWTEPKEASSEADLSTRCYKDDPTVCLLYDRKGSIAGYQISLPKDVDKLTIPGISFKKMGFTQTVLYDKPLYTTRIFYESQDQIKSGGRRWDGKTGTGLWLPIEGTLQEIPLKEADLAAKQPNFKKQNCYKKMGVHYFYNISREAKQEYFQPFFLLYSTSGDLQGWGLNVFGANASKMAFKEYFTYFSRRHWFENVPTSKIRDVAPDTPDWALQYKDHFGLYSHHVYMVDKPWDITC